MLNKELIFCLYYLIIVQSVFTVETDLNSNYASFPAKEEGECYKRVPYNDAIAANISRGTITVVPGSQATDVKMNRGRAWVTIIDCCDGYIRNPVTGKCEGNCDEGCFGGTCTGPNHCTCEDGWQPEAGVCKPICRRTCPQNSYCFAPEICSCKFGYEEFEGVCRPVCLHGCAHGECVAPRECRCHNDYVMDKDQRCQPTCAGGCHYGRCTSPGVCTCDPGYRNPPNDLERCVIQCPDTCKNGRCFSPNVCTCDPGYIRGTNDSCDPECEGGCVNGRCIAPDQCICNSGFAMDRHFRRCVEISHNNAGQNSFQTNRMHGNSDKQTIGEQGNNFNHATVPSVVTYGYENTDQPIELSQVQGTSNPLNKHQLNKPYGTTPISEAHGSEGIVGNKNLVRNGQKNTYEANDQYDMNRSRQMQNTQTGVKGVNPVRNRQETNIGYDIYIYNEPHSSQGQVLPSRIQNPDENSNINERYKDYDTRRLQGSIPIQRPYTTEGSVQESPDSYSTSNSYGVYENNPNYKPRRPIPSQSQTQDSRRLYGQYQPQNPQILYQNPQIYKVEGSLPVQNENKLFERQGIKMAYTPQYDPYSRERSENIGNIYNQKPNLNHGIHNPLDTYSHGGNTDISLTRTNGRRIPGANYHGAICDFPCLNGECIGRNQCACKQGYELDPTNPSGNKCLPICYGGCLNGVCTAPNLCICKMGFIKEHGIKGSQRCVPANY